MAKALKKYFATILIAESPRSSNLTAMQLSIQRGACAMSSSNLSNDAGDALTRVFSPNFFLRLQTTI